MMHGTIMLIGVWSLLFSTWICDACVTRRWHKCSTIKATEAPPDRAKQLDRFTLTMYKKLMKNIKLGRKRIQNDEKRDFKFKTATIKDRSKPPITATTTTTTTVPPLRFTATTTTKLSLSKNILSLLSYVDKHPSSVPARKSAEMAGSIKNKEPTVPLDEERMSFKNEDAKKATQLNQLILEFLMPDESLKV